jgi:hypothetical protein
LRDARDLAGATAALERAIQANQPAAARRLADVYRAQSRPADNWQLTALAAADPSLTHGGRWLAEARQGRYDAALATLQAHVTGHRIP